MKRCVHGQMLACSSHMELTAAGTDLRSKTGIPVCYISIDIAMYGREVGESKWT